MNNIKYLMIFMASLLIGSSSLAEEYYTWVDENGVRNYGEKLPVGYEGAKLEAEADQNYKPDASSASADTADASDSSEEGEEESDSDIDISKETAEIEAQIAKEKRSNCGIGKRNLAQLQGYSRIRVKDEEGNEKVLSESEKQSEINEARKIIRENCSG